MKHNFLLLAFCWENCTREHAVLDIVKRNRYVEKSVNMAQQNVCFTQIHSTVCGSHLEVSASDSGLVKRCSTPFWWRLTTMTENKEN